MTLFWSEDDVLQDVIGPAYRSHPKESAAILRHLAQEGVEVVYRKGQLAYLAAQNSSGRMILDPDASLGALRHEYRHFLDVQAAGFPGMRPYYENPAEYWRLEYRAYLEEVTLARQVRNFSAARKIVGQMRARRQEAIGR
jgi:hypothetical protein